MERQIVFKNDHYQWIDVIHPTQLDLSTIAEEYSIPYRAVMDCMNPENLPKYEYIEGTHFLLFRTFDSQLLKGDTAQELTHKLVIFISDTQLITIHRSEIPFLEKIKNRWSGMIQADPSRKIELQEDIFFGMIETFENPIDNSLNNLEKLEMGVFDAEGAEPFSLHQGYHLKRRASVFKRLLKLTTGSLEKFEKTITDKTLYRFQQYREQIQNLLIYSEDLEENTNTLLNLHISLASQRTNEASFQTGEIVRILTIFSIFLLPLNLVTGIYGMNFEHMPELRSRYGYPITLCTMLVIVSVIYWWFRKKGWLKL